MSNSEGNAGIWVTSGADPDGKPTCLITWDGQDWIAPVEDVRVTALDLVTCAAYAEVMMQLVTEVGIPPRQVSAFMTGLLATAGRSGFGTEQAVTLMPAGSSEKRQPVVLLEHGSLKGAVSPAEARGMAIGWLQAAEASESDALVARALRDSGGLDGGEREDFFHYLRGLRTSMTTKDGR